MDETKSEVKEIYIVHAHERGEGSSILKAFASKYEAERFAMAQPQSYVDQVEVERTELVLA